jgi:hypothetical protein
MSGPLGVIDPNDPRERFIAAYVENTLAIRAAAAEVAASRTERERTAERLERLEEYEREAKQAIADQKAAEKERARKERAETKTWRENVAWLVALPEFRLTVAAIMGGLLLRYVPGVTLPDPPKEAPRAHVIAPGGSDAP